MTQRIVIYNIKVYTDYDVLAFRDDVTGLSEHDAIRKYKIFLRNLNIGVDHLKFVARPRIKDGRERVVIV